MLTRTDDKKYAGHTPMEELHSGREDMDSYRGSDGVPFANVYEKSTGAVLATFVGDSCKPDRRLFVDAPKLLRDLLNTEQQRDALYLSLKSVEFGALVQDEPGIEVVACPWCGNSKNVGHHTGCQLRAALALCEAGSDGAEGRKEQS